MRTPASTPRSRARRRRATTPAEMEARLRALHAVALMRREGISARTAAARAHTSPVTLSRYAHSVLRKRKGRLIAVPLDELRRPMRVLTERGVVIVDVRDSRTATRIATYWNAVDTYLRTGDRRALAAFAGRTFRAGGHRWVFITDPRLLERLANAGQVSFENLYSETA